MQKGLAYMKYTFKNCIHGCCLCNAMTILTQTAIINVKKITITEFTRAVKFMNEIPTNLILLFYMPFYLFSPRGICFILEGKRFRHSVET